MSSLFMPKEQGEFDLANYVGEDRQKRAEEILIIARGNTLYSYDFDSGPKIIKEREFALSAFCEFKGNVYDACEDGKIRNTLSDDVIFSEEHGIHKLCPHYNLLFAGLDAGLVVEVTNNKIAYEGYKRLGDVGDITSSGDIFAVGSHDKVLYHADCEHIFTTFHNKPPVDIIRTRHGDVLDLCSHNEWLYDCGSYNGVYNTLTNECFDVGADELSGMFVYKKRLFAYDFEGEIFDVGKRKSVTKLDMDAKIFSVHRECLEVLL